MESNLKVSFSNRVESLFQRLQSQLFATSHPLTKRLVIVPSAAMKSWLMLQMAQHSQLGIAAGVEMGFVDPTLKRLFTLLHLDKSVHDDTLYEPSECELALAIESLIHEMIHAFTALPMHEQSILLPLLEYLGVAAPHACSITRRGSKRAGALSITLAKLFVDYGKYGDKMLAAWSAENPLGKNSGWQQLLWKKLETLFQRWNFPCRKFESFNPTADFAAEDLQIHLFGLSYLAPLHHRFLIQLAARVPVYYYMLSPCQKFWSDVLSDKESMHVKKFWHRRQAALSQQDALEDFLRDNNPLLANFGRLGREMTTQLDLSDPLIEECYCLPATVLLQEPYRDLLTHEIEFKDSAIPELTLLEALQADVALLRNPEQSEKIHFSHYDGTVQIHAAPKPMREVQVIYDTILSIIEKHARDPIPITPGDVVVMASNLTIYEPFIHAVFESQESCLAAHLIDMQLPSRNTFIQGFLHLLRLPLGRWDIASLLRLFGFSSFQARHQLKPEDVQLLQQWVRAADIRWGKDPSHRNELLKRDHCAKDMDEDCWHGTWEHGLGRLLEGLAMLSPAQVDNIEMEYAPLEKIDASQGELLGNFLHLLRALLADLQPLMGNAQLSLADWSSYLKCLSESYFTVRSEEDEGEGCSILMAQLATLQQVHPCIKDKTFAFHSIQRHLEKAFQSHTTTYRESNLQAVRFCSLLPMRAVPAKVIVLMGMGDGEFPRSEQALSLNLLTEHSQGDYYPTQIDFDRYLFLEALLSARDYFIMSYVAQKPGDSQLLLPSLLITELLSYIDKAYKMETGQGVNWGQACDLQFEVLSSNVSGGAQITNHKPDPNLPPASTGLLAELCCRRHPLFAFHHSYFSAERTFHSYSVSQFRAATAFYQQEKKPSHTFLQNFLPLPIINEALITYTAKNIGQKQDEQDRKRQDEQDKKYPAHPAACDPVHPVLLPGLSTEKVINTISDPRQGKDWVQACDLSFEVPSSNVQKGAQMTNHKPDPNLFPASTPSHEIVIDLADLSAFTKSPLKVYFNKALDIYLDRSSERVLKKHEELLLSPLDTAILLKEAMRTPADDVLARAKKAGRLPSGPFRTLEIERFKREVTVMRSNLDTQAISPEAIFTIEFNERYTKVEKAAAGWKLPPLHLEVPMVGQVRLIGRLESVSMKGLIVMAEDNVKEAIKVWPLCLAFCCLVNHYDLPIAPRLIFIKGKKSGVKEADFKDPELLLTHFLEYYFGGLKSPSPLLPECVQPMLVGNFDQVKDLYQTPAEDEFRPIYDEYLKWFKRSSPHTDIAAGNEHWQALATKLFVDMSQAWYPKRSQKEIV